MVAWINDVEIIFYAKESILRIKKIFLYSLLHSIVYMYRTREWWKYYSGKMKGEWKIICEIKVFWVSWDIGTHVNISCASFVVLLDLIHSKNFLFITKNQKFYNIWRRFQQGSNENFGLSAQTHVAYCEISFM